MNKINKATELHKSGYNCCQSVFAAFADLYGMDEATALKLSTSFGGGVGGTQNICGAVSGMAMVAGLECGTTDPNDKEGKKHNYDIVKSLLQEFEKQNGSIICKELLERVGAPTSPQEKPCSKYVQSCARLIQERLLQNKDE